MGTAPQRSPVPPLSLVLTGLVPRPDQGGRPLSVHGRLPGDEPHRQSQNGLQGRGKPGEPRIQGASICPPHRGPIQPCVPFFYIDEEISALASLI